jgi:hypothetical protein
MRLADARWPEQQYDLLTFQEGERRQLAQLAFVDRRLEGEVELVQALVRGSAPTASSAGRSWCGLACVLISPS